MTSRSLNMYLPPEYYGAVHTAAERLSAVQGRPIKPGRVLMELIAKGLESQPALADLSPRQSALE